MLGILRLIRIRTLLFAVFAMCAMRYCITLPMWEGVCFTVPVTNGQFLLFMVAVCCLISGAYAINDYFDVKPDRISGVRDVVVGRSVSRRATITLHTVLNVIAVAIACYLSFVSRVWWIALVFLFASGVLWGYSSIFRKHFRAGCLLVAFLAALIPLSVVVYEMAAMREILKEEMQIDLDVVRILYGIGFVVAWMTFLNTLIYEINKDIYTLDGDRENRIKTFPIRYGLRSTRRLLRVLTAVAMLSAAWAFYAISFWNWEIWLYAAVTILLPYAAYFWLIGKANSRNWQLNLLRTLMVTCVSFCFILMLILY